MLILIRPLLVVAFFACAAVPVDLLAEEIVTKEMVEGAKKDYEKVRERFNAAKEKVEYVHKDLNDFKDAVTTWRKAITKAAQDAGIEGVDDVLKGITSDSLSKISDKFKGSGDDKLTAIWNKAVKDFTEDAAKRAQPWLKKFAKGLDKRKGSGGYMSAFSQFERRLRKNGVFKHLETAKNAFDAADHYLGKFEQACNFVKLFQPVDGGNTNPTASLEKIANVLDACADIGGRVPLIGDIIKGYADVTRGFVTALGALDEKLKGIRQGSLYGQLHGGDARIVKKFDELTNDKEDASAWLEETTRYPYLKPVRVWEEFGLDPRYYAWLDQERAVVIRGTAFDTMAGYFLKVKESGKHSDSIDVDRFFARLMAATPVEIAESKKRFEAWARLFQIESQEGKHFQGALTLEKRRIDHDTYVSAQGQQFDVPVTDVELFAALCFYFSGFRNRVQGIVDRFGNAVCVQGRVLSEPTNRELPDLKVVNGNRAVKLHVEDTVTYYDTWHVRGEPFNPTATATGFVQLRTFEEVGHTHIVMGAAGAETTIHLEGPGEIELGSSVSVRVVFDKGADWPEGARTVWLLDGRALAFARQTKEALTWTPEQAGPALIEATVMANEKVVASATHTLQVGEKLGKPGKPGTDVAEVTPPVDPPLVTPPDVTQPRPPVVPTQPPLVTPPDKPQPPQPPAPPPATPTRPNTVKPTTPRPPDAPTVTPPTVTPTPPTKPNPPVPGGTQVGVGADLALHVTIADCWEHKYQKRNVSLSRRQSKLAPRPGVNTMVSASLHVNLKDISADPDLPEQMENELKRDMGRGIGQTMEALNLQGWKGTLLVRKPAFRSGGGRYPEPVCNQPMVQGYAHQGGHLIEIKGWVQTFSNAYFEGINLKAMAFMKREATNAFDEMMAAVQSIQVSGTGGVKTIPSSGAATATAPPAGPADPNASVTLKSNKAELVLGEEASVTCIVKSKDKVKAYTWNAPVKGTGAQVTVRANKVEDITVSTSVEGDAGPIGKDSIVIRVRPPEVALKVAISPAAPRIAQTVTATVTATPPPTQKGLEDVYFLRWDVLPEHAKLLKESQDRTQITFLLTEPKAAEVLVRAISRKEDKDIGIGRGTVTAQRYDVTATATRATKIKTHQHVRLHAAISPKPEQPPQYKWRLVGEDNHFVGVDIGEDVTVTRSRGGALQARATATTRDGYVLGEGAVSVHFQGQGSRTPGGDSPANADLAAGEQALGQGNLEGAEQAFKNAAQKDPAVAAKAKEGLKQVGRKALEASKQAARQRDYEAAVKHAEQAARLSPNDADVQAHLTEMKRRLQAYARIPGLARRFDEELRAEKVWTAQKTLLEAEKIENQFPGGTSETLKRMSARFHEAVRAYNQRSIAYAKTIADARERLDWEALARLAKERLAKELTVADRASADGNLKDAARRINEQREALTYYDQIEREKQAGLIDPAGEKLNHITAKLRVQKYRFAVDDPRHKKFETLARALEATRSQADGRKAAASHFQRGDQRKRELDYAGAADSYRQGLTWLENGGLKDSPDYAKYEALMNHCLAIAQKLNAQLALARPVVNNPNATLPELQRALLACNQALALVPRHQTAEIYANRLKHRITAMGRTPATEPIGTTTTANTTKPTAPVTPPSHGVGVSNPTDPPPSGPTTSRPPATSTAAAINPRSDEERVRASIKQYYETKGEWAGQFHMTGVQATRYESLGANKWRAHVRYDFLCVTGTRKGERGVDERTFDILRGGPGGWHVTAMGGNLSGNVDGRFSPKARLDTGNRGGVSNGPTRPTTFKISRPHQLVHLQTYHWNHGKGAPPGTLTLRHNSGKTYGPWRAMVKPTNPPNLYWYVKPFCILPAGTYTVVDSDPSTWAQNAESGGRGHAIIDVRAVAGAKPAGPAGRPPATPAKPARPTPARPTTLPHTTTIHVTFVNAQSQPAHLFTNIVGEKPGPGNRVAPNGKRQVSLVTKRAQVPFYAFRNGRTLTQTAYTVDASSRGQSIRVTLHANGRMSIMRIRR